MSSFSDAISGGMATIASAAGEAVTYWRGTDFVEIFDAVPGSSLMNTIDSNEMAIASRSRDWIFQACKLVLNGAPITPRRGDVIRQTIGGVTTAHEVNFDGEQVYRFCDRGRTRIRVHTKEMPNG